MQPSYTHSRSSLRSLLIIPLALVALFMLQSCGDDPVSNTNPIDTTGNPTDTTKNPTDTTKNPTDTTKNPTDTSIVPKVGSSYSFEQTEVDANGQPTSDVDVSTLTVTSTDTSYSGKTRVTLFDPDHTANYLALNYEISGDISVLTPGQVSLHSGTKYLLSPTVWATYPFATKGAMATIIDFDTTGTIDGETKSLKVVHTVEYLGSEEVTVGTETFTAQKVVEKIHRVDTDTKGSVTADYTTTFWYVKRIGFFTRIDETRIDDAGNTSRTRRILKRYTLE